MLKKFATFRKKKLESFGSSDFSRYLCTRLKKYGSVAQLNRASDYGSEGYRFESCRSHNRAKENFTLCRVLFFVCPIRNKPMLSFNPNRSMDFRTHHA